MDIVAIMCIVVSALLLLVAVPLSIWSLYVLGTQYRGDK